MTISVAVINGRYRQVTEVHSRGSVVTADCITGYTSKKAVAGKSPGAGWKIDMAFKNDTGPKHWIRNFPTIERVTIAQADFLELDAWPSRELDAREMDELIALIRPHIDRAVDQGGVRARRVMPELRVETVELFITGAGLPMPNPDQYSTALKAAWEAAVPKDRVAGKATKAIVGKVAPRPSIEQATKASESTDTNPVVDTLERKSEVPDGYYFSTQLTRNVEDTEENRLIDAAIQNGWPYEKLTGATKTKKGISGFTLRYATKNAYDPKVHGQTA